MTIVQRLLKVKRQDWVIILAIPLAIDVIYLLGLWFYFQDLSAFSDGNSEKIDAFYQFSIFRTVPIHFLLISSFIALFSSKRKKELFRNFFIGFLLGKLVLVLEHKGFFFLSLLWKFHSHPNLILLVALLLSILCSALIIHFLKLQNKSHTT